MPVSRYFGAGSMENENHRQRLCLAFILSIVLGIFGFGFPHWMMSTLQTPADILDDAVYLRVYFVGFLFVYVQHSFNDVYFRRRIKNSTGTPDIFVSLKYFMDLWMVAGLDLGVFGAALATLIAQGISAVFSLLIFAFTDAAI